jgi:hypothetical protein
LVFSSFFFLLSLFASTFKPKQKKEKNKEKDNGIPCVMMQQEMVASAMM